MRLNSFLNFVRHNPHSAASWAIGREVSMFSAIVRRNVAIVDVSSNVGCAFILCGFFDFVKAKLHTPHQHHSTKHQKVIHTCQQPKIGEATGVDFYTYFAD